MDEAILRCELFKDPLVLRLRTLARAENIPLFLVGGFLRDLLLGASRKDYDLTLPRDASHHLPAIEAVLGFRFFKVGKDERDTAAYRILQDGLSVDLTWMHGDTISEDLLRRDFTINAIACSLLDDTFHAVGGAFEDVRMKKIRAVSRRSIDQDPLRMLRAVRYASTLDGFGMDPTLAEEIRLKKERVRSVSGERIKMEFDRILLSPARGVGVRTLYDLNLLLTLFPEFTGLETIAQNEYHHLPVLPHLLLILEKTEGALDWMAAKGEAVSLPEQDRLSLQYAALFHDIGKQHTFSQDERGKVHFYHHERFSCRAAAQIMARLRFSRAMMETILLLVKHHMRILNLPQETRETALRRLVHRMGDRAPLLVALSLADKEASRGALAFSRDEIVEAHCLRILALYKNKEIVHPPSLITGQDVIRMGWAPGPRVGKILRSVRQKQVTGEIRTREEALDLLRGEFHD